MKFPTTFENLVEEAKAYNLYPKLIAQLNKDFLYANISLDLSEAVLPTSLKLILDEIIFELIQEKFTEYLNLLYIIDVPEEVIKKLEGYDTLQLAKQVSFLILKREWQKVWFRNHY